MMRLAIAIGCLLVIVTTPSGADEPESRFPPLVTLAPKKLDQGSIQGEAFIRLKPATVARGESFILECEIRCTSGAADVWNGFLSEDVILPAQIIIASTDGKVRHELLRRHQEPPAGHQPTRWIFLRSTDSIGRELQVKVDARSEAVADRSPRDRIVDLLPGEYTVQAIYNHWLIAPRLRRDEQDGAPRPWETWTAEKMETPVAVSKTASLVVR